MHADIGLGIIVALIATKIFGIEISTQLVGISILCALLPDIDFIIRAITRRTIGGKDAHVHRELLHYPLPYIAIGSGIALFFGSVWTFVFAAASLAHFLHDAIGIGWGVKLLWPFSKKNFTLYQADTHTWFFWKTDAEVANSAAMHGKDDWIRYYYARPTAVSVIEGMLFVGALVLLWSAVR
jgi:hypothetical protein